MGRRASELTLTDIQKVPEYADGDHFNELEKAVLQYAAEMTETPVRMAEDNFEFLKSNFSPKQIVELTSSIAWENWRARYNHALGIESADFQSDVTN